MIDPIRLSIMKIDLRPTAANYFKLIDLRPAIIVYNLVLLIIYARYRPSIPIKIYLINRCDAS